MDSTRLGQLTPKERECLRLVARHLSSKQIARELGIAKSSVDTYCNRARLKLGVDDRYEAARLVIESDGAAQLQPRTPAPTAMPSPVAVLAAEPVPAPVAATWRIPPLANLNPAQRLGMIFLMALVVALVFGVLLSGLHSLEDLSLLAVYGETPAHAGVVAVR